MTKAKDLSIELHKHLVITDKEWHKQKNNGKRRSAELLSAALVQLLQEGNRDDVKELVQQAILWIKEEVKDKGCPNKKSF